MRRLLVGLEGLVVAVDLVEGEVILVFLVVEDEVILVFLVVEDVEAQTAGLVAYGADRIVLGSSQEAVAQVRLHLQGHDQCEHGLRIVLPGGGPAEWLGRGVATAAPGRLASSACMTRYWSERATTAW